MHYATSENPARFRSQVTPAPKSRLTGLRARLTAEESDQYRDIVADLSPGLRVIRCRAGIQWILQAKIGARWRGCWFCHTKEALLRGAGQYAAHPALVALPDRFELRRIAP
jgi:hypothetical protein